MIEHNKVKTIFLSGGGTGGSVTPLLAVAEELLKSSPSRYRLVFVGTKKGPEQEMIANFNSEVGRLDFKEIKGGKLRRYFSWHNFQDFFNIILAFWQSLSLMAIEKPNLVISAGSFVSVPLVWAAALKKVPILIHQQDVRPGLANKLMAPFATVITVALEKSLLDYGPQAVYVGNPMRPFKILDKQVLWNELKEKYGLVDGLPLILITGGRLGAQTLNNLIYKSRNLFADFQTIHLVGNGKLPELRASEESSVSVGVNKQVNGLNYRLFESLSNKEIIDLMMIADIVISRCGLGVLTELSFLKKASILIPLPDSHQEDNAAVFEQASAALVLSQKDLTAVKLIKEIKRILSDAEKRHALENNIAKIIKKGANERMLGIIEEILNR